MDACLTESVVLSEKTSIPERTPSSDISRRLAYAAVAVVAVGVIWRIVRYFGHFPIWGDEAMLLLNLLDRDYAGLTQHLRFAQVAPLFFLWLERSAILLFGTSEASLHLFPFLAGLGTLFTFWFSVRRSFSPAVAGLAMALLAVSYYPVRHSAEVKPYAFDLFFAVAFASLALGRLRSPDSSRWMAGLLALSPVAVFTSYPSVFVGGAVSLVLLPAMARTTWRERFLYALFNLSLLASFIIHYTIVGQQQIDIEEAQRTREFLRTYWKEAFPPDQALLWPVWIAKVFTGNMLAHPIGANHGGSTGTFILVVLGTFSLWRARNWSLLGLCWLPFALNLVAAIMKKYPFGDSARITLHLTPFICILAAYGVMQTLEWIRSENWRNRLHLAIYCFLIALAVIGISRDLIKPFKTEHDRQIRVLADDVAAATPRTEPIFLVHDRDEDLLAEFLWYLRVRPIDLRWRRQLPDLAPTVKACRLIRCGPSEPTTAFILASMPMAGWHVVEETLRTVPPENREMPTMYCRILQMERD